MLAYPVTSLPGARIPRQLPHCTDWSWWGSFRGTDWGRCCHCAVCKNGHDPTTVAAMVCAVLCCATQMDGMVFVRTEPKPPDYLIARIKPAQLPDVLRLLLRRAVCEESAADAAVALLEHDRTQLHVLHSSSECGAAGGSSDGTAGGSSRRSRSGGESLPGWYLAWFQKGTKAALDQQQWRLTQEAALQLVEELLGVCVTYNMGSLCQAIAALPVARDIGESAAGECQTRVRRAHLERQQQERAGGVAWQVDCARCYVETRTGGSAAATVCV